MHYKPCDQLASDIFEAQIVAQKKTGVACRLDLHIAETLIEEVSARYEADLELEPILDSVLRGNFIGADDEPERTGYKCMLGKFFGRRAQYEREKRDTMVEHFASIALTRS